MFVTNLSAFQVEWAKNLHPFPELSMEDKIILLKNYAPQHLILMPAFRRWVCGIWNWANRQTVFLLLHE